jgi:hypothetical protein
MELRILVDLRKDAAIQTLRNDARFNSMSEEIKATAIAILDGHVQVFDRLDVLTQTVQRGQNETSTLIKESEDKIVNAIAALANSASPANLSRSTRTPLKVSSKTASEVESIILEDLSFGRTMELRQQIVSSAHKATFRWILCDSSAQEKPWDNLMQWLRNDGGCYWINGKAASGKSTLMKFLTGQPETRAALEVWSGSNELLIVPFFFWHLGTELQKSQTGLLRSLLHFILSRYRSLIAKVIPGYYNDVARKLRNEEESEQLASVEPLTSIELKLAIFKMFDVLPETLSLCFFIDGIDEFSGDHTDLGDLLKTIVSHKVKMVLSSRPIGPCITAFGEYPKLRLQDLTKDDINSYIEAQFGKNPYKQLLSKNKPEDVHQLMQEISLRSSGIFLWVELVMKSLLRGLIDGDQMDDLRKRLCEYPRELEPLYKHMLDGVNESYRIQASKYLQILLRSIEVQLFEPISLSQMSFADEDDPNAVLKMPSRTISNAELSSRNEVIKRRIVSRCCGLIEWTYLEDAEPRDSAVNFLHKSVVDFLRKPDTWAFVTSLTAGINYDTNWTLASSCLHMLKIVEHKALVMRKRRSGRIFFFEYVVEYCRGGEKSSDEVNFGFLRELSNLLLDPGERKEYQDHVRSRGRGQFLGRLPQGKEIEHVSTLALAVFHSLPLHTQTGLELCPPSYVTKEGAGLLWAAVSQKIMRDASQKSHMPALEETVECLLKNGADPNLATKIRLSPWASTLSGIWAFSCWMRIAKTREQQHFSSIPSKNAEVLILAYFRICEMFLLHGAHANAVVCRPKLANKRPGSCWSVDDEMDEAFSALALIKDFSHAKFESRQMRNTEVRLVKLLVKQGAESRHWVGGKQISGPQEKTPLSVLVMRSSMSTAQLKNGRVRSDLDTKSGKGFRDVSGGTIRRRVGRRYNWRAGAPRAHRQGYCSHLLVKLYERSCKSPAYLTLAPTLHNNLTGAVSV